MDPPCNISRCATDPDYCEQNVHSVKLFELTVIVILPILIAFFAPLCARSTGFWSCLHDDDSPQAPAWAVMESPIDPPMFLCGLGLLPHDCGTSGLLTCIVVMIFAFVTVFFSMLTAEWPCTTKLGQCRTISCICGIMPEGYVFMFCMLVLTSTILVQRFSEMVHHHRIQHRILKPMLILGSLLLTLTAIFPQRYDSNGSAERMPYSLLDTLHLVGVFGSGIILVIVPFLWFVEHWWTHRHRRPSERVPLRSLVARTCYFVSITCFGCAMIYATSDAQVSDQTYEVCGDLRTAEDCEAWPRMPAERCNLAHQCVVGMETPGCEGFRQPNFECAWMTSTYVNNWTATIMPKSFVQDVSCVRLRCPIHSYARGVALEFAVLLLTLSYVSVFGLHDVRRLLDRPPPDHNHDHNGRLQPIGINADTSMLPLRLGHGAGATLNSGVTPVD